VAQRFSAAERPNLLPKREGHGFSRAASSRCKSYSFVTLMYLVIVSGAKDLRFAPAEQNVFPYVTLPSNRGKRLAHGCAPIFTNE
jgi:hypothetical protein